MDYINDDKSVMQTKNCLHCGAPVYGRTDKVFCGESCKNKYHNFIRLGKRRRRLNTLSQLDLNYEILNNVIMAGTDHILISIAREHGFRTEYCTAYIPYNHNARIRCYDIEYTISCSRIIHIHYV